MTDKDADMELMIRCIEEFSRLQEYMTLTDKGSEAYKCMKIRYVQLKIMLNLFKVNLTELDIIKE